MKKTSSLRVALIGCGAIAEQMHLPVLAGHPGLSLAALVDRDLDRAKRFARGYGVAQTLADAADLTTQTVDAAVVATPPFHHAPCTIDLLNRGIHVLVEKPMATSYEDAVAMVEAAEKAGVVLSVGFFRRLYPSIRLMKALLHNGWPGRPRHFLVEGGGMYNWPAATLGNMKREWAGGGVLIDFGSHMVDLMLYLFSTAEKGTTANNDGLGTKLSPGPSGEGFLSPLPPPEIVEYRDNSLGGVEADCSIAVQIQFAGEPVEGRIELARTRELGSCIRVECEKATLEFQVSERFRIRVIPHGTELTDPVGGQARGFWFDASWQQESGDESWYATFARQFDDWLSAIEAKQQPVLSATSALPTAQLIEACYRQPKPIDEPWVWRGIPDRAAEHTARSRDLLEGVREGGRTGRILVTGASGFIGCRVVELLRLREKCDVRALVHNPGNASRLARLDVEMVQADLGSADDVKRVVEDCDAIVHCAIGTAWGEPQKIHEINVGGTRRLAEEALARGLRRFVHVSTMSVYGDDGVLTGILDENTPIRPQSGSVYGESKAAAERIVLALADKGLPSVVFRPARVFGPFSRIFITRPIPAIAEGRFEWLGSPDVASDMVYVDNVAEALLAALFADPDRVAGQAFNISDGDHSTWRDFYAFFADQLNLDVSTVPIRDTRQNGHSSAFKSMLAWPQAVMRGMGEIVGSPEFKTFGRRVLQTDPIGTVPRKALDRFPGLERGVRRIVGADDSLPVYLPQEPRAGAMVGMGSGGAVLSIEKLRDVLGFQPPVTRAVAMQLTLDWVRHARLV